MTTNGLISAVAVGLLIGVLGRPVVPGSQGLPVWLTIAMGIGASLLGALVAERLGRADSDGID